MSRFRSNRLHFSEVLVLIAIVLIIATMMFSIVILPFLNVETNTITVTKVENIVDGKNSTYLLFTESEVFENSDCFIRGKFDSSDFYNQFKDLGTFEVKTYGYRIPFFSMYKNVYEITGKVPDAELTTDEEAPTDDEKEERRKEYERLKKEFSK
jgi:hypothetical protein